MRGIPERVLVAPGPFGAELRATEVAAALGRGLEAAGCPPPDLCPVADGGPGTMEVLLTSLGGETAAAETVDGLGRSVRGGFALIEGGAVAVVEAVGGAAGGGGDATTSAGTGMLVAAAARAGAGVILVAAGAGGVPACDGGLGAVKALAAAGGVGGARIVVLCDVRAPFEAALVGGVDEVVAALARDPRGVAMGGAGGGLAGALWAACDAVLEPGAPFVLGELGFDTRMRAARAVFVGAGRLDRAVFAGKAAGEAATRARQAGVPCFAVTARNELDAFEARILDLQRVVESGTVAGLEAAAAGLADVM